MRKLSRQGREPFLHRNRIFLQVHESESFEQSEIHRMQRIIPLVECWHLIHVRRADQASIEAVGPGMIWTLNRGGLPAGLFLQTGAAMPAQIVKSTDRRFLITDHNQTFSSNLREKVLARLCDLTLMAG